MSNELDWTAILDLSLHKEINTFLENFQILFLNLIIFISHPKIFSENLIYTFWCLFLFKLYMDVWNILKFSFTVNQFQLDSTKKE